MDRTSASNPVHPAHAPTPASTRRHPASLIPKFMHDPALLEFVRSPVTPEMVGKSQIFHVSICFTFTHVLPLQPTSPRRPSKSFNVDPLLPRRFLLLPLPRLNKPSTQSMPKLPPSLRSRPSSASSSKSLTFKCQRSCAPSFISIDSKLDCPRLPRECTAPDTESSSLLSSSPPST